jgi:hypothetical protein
MSAQVEHVTSRPTTGIANATPSKIPVSPMSDMAMGGETMKPAATSGAWNAASSARLPIVIAARAGAEGQTATAPLKLTSRKAPT